jgi:hypothetical protein
MSDERFNDEIAQFSVSASDLKAKKQGFSHCCAIELQSKFLGKTRSSGKPQLDTVTHFDVFADTRIDPVFGLLQIFVNQH